MASEMKIAPSRGKGGGDNMTQGRWPLWNQFVSQAFRTKSLNQIDIGHEELSRSLSVIDLTLMGVGGSIGAGIFVLTGVAARQAGPAVVFSFALAAFGCTLDALCYAELASRFPVSGSAYLYTLLSFGELPALAVGINLLFDYHVGAAAIARSMSVYFVKMLASWGLQLPKALGEYKVNEVLNFSVLAPVFLAIFTIILVRGVRESKYTNMALTSLKVTMILLVVFGGVSKVDDSNWSPFVPLGISSIFSTTSTVFFSYIGFDVVANAAEEASRPARDLPVAIVVSLAICAVLYCAVCLILTGLISYENISKTAPLSDALSEANLKWGQQIIDIGAVVGLGTTLLTGMYAQSRLYLSIARDGLVPKILGRVSGDLRVPVFAQIWCGVLAAVLAAPFNVEELSKILSIGIMAAYSLVCLSVLSLRTRGDSSLYRWVGLYCLLGLGFSLSVRIGLPYYVSIVLLVGTLLIWYPVYTRYSFSVDGSDVGRDYVPGFQCPLVPAVPMLGLLANIFMAVQLHWAAWVRLAAVTLLLLIVYVFRSGTNSVQSLQELKEELLDEGIQENKKKKGNSYHKLGIHDHDSLAFCDDSTVPRTSIPTEVGSNSPKAKAAMGSLA
mmetsp:Transcript_11237/g.27628  ORF Transcript_11237/g.27628 Transcript_11237/m.27628 type:complete len:613 (-) Transcript_11237:32-1870(-)